MKKILCLFVLPLLALTLFINCEGDEGPQGPQGEQGEQGIQGIPGIQGETGTANVIYSAWIAVGGSWRDSTVEADNVNVKHIVESKITQEVLDQGLVLVYFKYFSLITPLPYTENSSTYGPFTVFNLLKPGKIILAIFTHDNSGNVSLNNSVEFRYIIIPGAISSTAKKSTVDLTALSYEDICLLYNIPK